jgi:NADH-quinone oxidoreductase subunit G
MKQSESNHIISKNFIEHNIIKFFMFNGALTNKPASFQFRSWELTKLKTYDLFDTFGQSIFVENRGMDIMRITPAESTLLEFPWISDKTRFFFDALICQRLANPFLKVNNQRYSITWLKVLEFMKYMLAQIKTAQYKKSLQWSTMEDIAVSCNLEILFIYHQFSDLKTLFAAKAGMKKLGGGSFIDATTKNIVQSTTVSSELSGSVFSEKILKSVVDNIKNVIILVGVDLRFEIPRLNVIFRNFIKRNHLRAYYIGVRTLGLHKYNFKHISSSFSAVLAIVEGRHFVLNYIKKYQQQVGVTSNYLIFGQSMVFYLNNLPINWLSKFNRLHKFTPVYLFYQVGALNMNFVHTGNSRVFFKNKRTFNFQEREVVVFDGFNSCDETYPKGVSAQNSFYINFTPFSSIEETTPTDGLLLPISAFLEREAFFLDIWGNFKKTNMVVLPPANHRITSVRTEYDILKHFFYFYDNSSLLSERVVKLFDNAYPQRKLIPFVLDSNDKFSLQNNYIVIPKVEINHYISNFYKTDLLCKHSKTLNIASSFFYDNLSNYD